MNLARLLILDNGGNFRVHLAQGTIVLEELCRLCIEAGPTSAARLLGADHAQRNSTVAEDQDCYFPQHAQYSSEEGGKSAC